MSSNVSRKETERTKLIQEKCQTLLTQMLRDEDNKYCVDCDAKGPRWASWNLGVFLCIRCAGIHRNLGVHISRVKSVNLDTWTPEQVISLQQMGNSRARAVYEAQLPDGFRRPQTDIALESFIRAKYEHKKYLAREWLPPSPPKVDWAKEIDDELDRQKRKKKAAQANNALGIGVMSSGAGGSNYGGGGNSDKKASIAGGNAARSVPLPAPLPKPKPGQSGSSPKAQRLSAGAATSSVDQQSNDLLGLSTPTKPIGQTSLGDDGVIHDLHNDSFSGFLSAPVSTNGDVSKTTATVQSSGAVAATSNTNALAKEEQDFFNQGSLGGAGGNDKDKSGKLTKDSILALYGSASSKQHNQQQLNFGQQPSSQQFTHNAFGNIPVGHSAINFTGMSPGFMGGATAGAPSAQQQQHNPQFMTPPNSASMYNAPVMTVPTAFSTPGIGGGMLLGNAGVTPGAFGAQFPNMQHVGYTAQMQATGLLPQHMMTMGGGIMATGQTTTSANAAQLMQANHNRLGGMAPLGMVGVGVMPQQPMQQMPSGSGNGMIGTGFPLGANVPIMGGASLAGNLSTFQTPPMTGSAVTGATTGNLNQQFGNLNIGNVWQ